MCNLIRWRHVPLKNLIIHPPLFKIKGSQKCCAENERTAHKAIGNLFHVPLRARLLIVIAQFVGGMRSARVGGRESVALFPTAIFGCPHSRTESGKKLHYLRAMLSSVATKRLGSDDVH